jgi:lipoprotein NlpI
LADYAEAIRLDPKDAFTWYNRSIFWRRNGGAEKAIADASEAIRLKPNLADAYAIRGLAWIDKGDEKRGFADLDKAISVDPKASSYRRRGYLHYFAGHYADAVSDFDQSARLDPKDLYGVIWRYLAKTRIGDSTAAGAELARASQDVANDKWPKPIIEFLNGKIDFHAAQVAAESPVPKTRSGQTCELNYYGGHSALMNHEPERARAMWRVARDECPANFIERQAAEVELKRLGG